METNTNLFLNKEVLKNSFYRDFLIFVDYIEKNNLKLTETKNIKLKDLTMINSLLRRKIQMEYKIGNRIYKTRSEYEMPYIRILDVLSEATKIIKRRKKQLKISEKNKKFFDLLSPWSKFNFMWDSYCNNLGWSYLQYLENGSIIAEDLQFNREYIWHILGDFDIKANYGWILTKNILKTIRKNLKIQWETAHGNDSDLACWGIEIVIFKNLLKIFDFVEIDKTTKKFKLTNLARKIITKNFNPANY